MIRTAARVACTIATGLAIAAQPGCSTGSATAVFLSLSSTDSLTPAVGATVHVVIHAVLTDSSSVDVTEDAACTLSGGAPPGTLLGTVFTATGAGTTDIQCTWSGAAGSIAITVAGARPVTALEVQRGDIQVGTAVALEGVVFAVEPDRDFTDLYVQDPGGGARSGIYLRDLRTLAPAEVGVAPAAIGDKVRVTGTYVERRGRSILEFTTIELIGTGTPVASVLAIADVDPTLWDGCFISIADVVVTNPMVDAYTWQIAPAATPTGPTLLVETLLYDAPRAADDHIQLLRGPLYLDAATPGAALEVAIMPRTAADVVGGGGGGGTVSDLNTGGMPDGTTVTVAGPIVVAVDPFTSTTTGTTFYDLFVQDAAGGPGAGIHVLDFRTAPTEVLEGAIVTITGTLGTVGGHRVIDGTDVTATGTQAPVATDLGLAGLDVGTYAAGLVRVKNVRVSNAATDAHAFEVVDDAGGAGALLVDDYFYAEAPQTNDTFASITGVVYCDATRCALAPRRASDVQP